MNLSRILFAAAAALGFAAPAVAQQVNIQTGSTYTFANTDCDPTGRTTVVFNAPSGTTVVATLPQAGGSGQFIACTIHAFNLTPGGVVAIVPQTSLIFGNNGASYFLGAFDAVDIDSSATAAATGNWYARHGQNTQSNITTTNFRNIVDNPEMQVQQRGTGVATCGTTAIAAANYSADRWACNANASGTAGRAAVVTSGLPAGLNGSQELYRNGADTHLQPICAMQEIAQNDVNNVAAGNADVSMWLKANSALSSTNSAVDIYVWTGTSADQGLGSFTASPALTPAWTGLAQSIHVNQVITAAWTRYDVGHFAVPAGAMEMAVAVCFTPIGTAGTTPTDGLNFTGVQITPGNYMQPYEQRTYGLEILKDFRYYYAAAEPATGVGVSSGAGSSATTTTCQLSISLPVAMRVVPTAIFAGGLPNSANAATTLGALTWEIVHAAASTNLSTPFLATNMANASTQLNLTATVASGLTAGQACILAGQQGSSSVGLIAASADY